MSPTDPPRTPRINSESGPAEIEGPWTNGSDAEAAAGLTLESATPSAIAGQLAALSERAAHYAARATGPGTRAAYASAWRGWSAWCAAAGQPALNGDPALLALYLTQRADDGLAVSSLRVIRSAVRAAHRLAGVPLDGDDARLVLVMEGITRAKSLRPRRQAAPAVPDVLRRLLAALPAPETPAAAAPALLARNRAILLLAFGAALRRSELAALALGDVTVMPDRGLTLLLRRSKTDQHGRGRSVAIWANPGEPAFCPLTAFQDWMVVRRDAPGGLAAERARLPSPAGDDRPGWAVEDPLFCGVGPGGALTGRAMADKILARLIKQACRDAGLDPARYSGHSARRGLLTHAGDLQLPLVDLMRQSRHRSVETALGYIEGADLWRNNITEAVFRAKPSART